MKEVLFLVTVITIVVAIVMDYIRFNWQVNEIIYIADELLVIYGLAIKKIKRRGSRY